MSDRAKLAREIAARTEPGSSRSSQSPSEIESERGGGNVPFIEEQLAAMRGGLTVEHVRRRERSVF